MNEYTEGVIGVRDLHPKQVVGTVVRSLTDDIQGVVSDLSNNTYNGDHIITVHWIDGTISHYYMCDCWLTVISAPNVQA